MVFLSTWLAVRLLRIQRRLQLIATVRLIREESARNTP